MPEISPPILWSIAAAVVLGMIAMLWRPVRARDA
jgi:hypothetical protein